jgi:hypothetical protein
MIYGLFMYNAQLLRKFNSNISSPNDKYLSHLKKKIENLDFSATKLSRKV